MGPTHGCLVSDLIVQAKSGTGKTCVFCTIALDSLILDTSATQVNIVAVTKLLSFAQSL